jgi:membrane protease subunit (stomatin/prohibitin family)
MSSQINCIDHTYLVPQNQFKDCKTKKTKEIKEKIEVKCTKDIRVSFSQGSDSDGCETAVEESQGGATIAQVIIRRAEGAILDTMHTITLAEMIAEAHCLGKRIIDSLGTFIEQFGVTVVTFSVVDVEYPPEIADALRKVDSTIHHIESLKHVFNVDKDFS